MVVVLKIAMFILILSCKLIYRIVKKWLHRINTKVVDLLSMRISWVLALMAVILMLMFL